MENVNIAENSLQVLQDLVIPLAFEPCDGLTTKTCHWADGAPLNFRLYERMLKACFDINDKTFVIEKVNEVLEIIQKTWVILGVDQVFHNICFAWVLFNQYVATDQAEIRLLFAADKLLSDVAKDAREVKNPSCSRTLSTVLELILSWGMERLLVYCDRFGSANTNIMGSRLSMDSSITKILAELNPSSHQKRDEDVAAISVAKYIDASMRHAFSKENKRLISSRESFDRQIDSLPILCILSTHVTELASSQRDIYRDVLKNWHPFPIGVATKTLHACYGDELGYYVSRVHELTPDAVMVLQAAESLEKYLWNLSAHEVVDGVTADEDNKNIYISDLMEDVRDPYKSEDVLINLVKSWIRSRVDAINELVHSSLEIESWDSGENKPVIAPSPTGGKVLRSIEEISIAFLCLPVTLRLALFQELMNGLDRSLEIYILTTTSGCGSWSSYMPTVPELTRCSIRSKFSRKDRLPRVVHRHQCGTNGDDSFSIPKLCIRINTLHYISEQLNVITSKIISKLKDNGLVPDDINMIEFFELSVASCLKGILELSEAISSKLILCKLSHVFWDYLYVEDVSSSRIEPFLQELKTNLDILWRTVHDGVQTYIISDVMKVLVDGVLLILLCGGRAFSVTDGAMVEEDLRLLKSFFYSYRDGWLAGRIDAFTVTLNSIIPLFRLNTDNLIKKLKTVTGDNFLISQHPLSANWSPTDPTTILRVLCYRKDKMASSFLKKKYKLPKA